MCWNQTSLLVRELGGGCEQNPNTLLWYFRFICIVSMFIGSHVFSRISSKLCVKLISEKFLRENFILQVWGSMKLLKEHMTTWSISHKHSGKNHSNCVIIFAHTPFLLWKICVIYMWLSKSKMIWITPHYSPILLV